MQVEIDKFGRIIIPKSVRSHMGITAGTTLELLEKNHEILLRLITKKSFLKEEGGILVYTGECVDSLDNVIEQERESRLKDCLE